MKYKTEVGAHTLRIVTDTGCAFEDDVIVVGDCRDPAIRRLTADLLSLMASGELQVSGPCCAIKRAA